MSSPILLASSSHPSRIYVILMKLSNRWCEGHFEGTIHPKSGPYCRKVKDISHTASREELKDDDLITMGIPYSRQINAAFEQVTPLVAEGFEVLQTTRNITFLLAEIQVATVVLLFLLLVATLMLLVTNNPDMEQERQALVTPVMKWICSWMMSSSGKRRYGLIAVTVVMVMLGLVYVHYWYYFKETVAVEELPGKSVDRMEGEEVDAMKEDKASQ